MAQGNIFIANANNQPSWSTITYPDTAGNSGSVIESDGTNFVSKFPEYYGFFAYQNGDIANVTGDGTIYDIICDVADLNIGSAYNTTTGVYTAPVDGLYLFNYTISIDSLNGSLANQLIHRVQGSSYAFILDEFDVLSLSNTSPVIKSGSFHLKMSAGDLVKIQTQISGTTKTIGLNGKVPIFGTECTIFSGNLVGRF